MQFMEVSGAFLLLMGYFLFIVRINADSFMFETGI
jgi:hypothetical protein